MPWKETCAMDERGRFVAEAVRKELSFAALCRGYSIAHSCLNTSIGSIAESITNGISRVVEAW